MINFQFWDNWVLTGTTTDLQSLSMDHAWPFTKNKKIKKAHMEMA